MPAVVYRPPPPPPRQLPNRVNGTGLLSSFVLQLKDPPTGHAALAVIGDRGWIQAFNGTSVQTLKFSVDAVNDPGSAAGYFNYMVHRTSTTGAGAAFPAGVGVAIFGQPGNGFISLSSDGTIGASANITVATISSTAGDAGWNGSASDIALRVRIGNLNGVAGLATDLYGAFVGDFAAGNYMKYDPTNGFILAAAGGTLILDGSGFVLTEDVAFDDKRAIRFRYGGVDAGKIFGYRDTIGTIGNMFAFVGQPITGYNTTVDIEADSSSGYTAEVGLIASSFASGANIRVRAASTASISLYGNPLDGVVISNTDFSLVPSPSALLHVHQWTLGNEVGRWESVATNDDPRESVYQNRAVTTDATVTTLHTVTIAASTTHMLIAYVIARRTGGTGGTAEDGAAYIVTACVKNVSGTATLIGSATTTIVGESQAGFDATIDVTSNTARVRVTGATNNNLTWHCTVRVLPVGT